ncbi:tRNA (adenosine(37)-N6)-dimethylallyltransferase MiaA [Deinococcus soli (ex Cha et al. 2016)]|uniref:tRNA dimethylallyltransferase n=1 Tax=Deinococcus soli (ex Cha et al. 2016) TaxID=1309411 RepID=A0A0F7JIG2_9DEIO|nr:tRNA (adenosine(37)-N6)-dimethylallyltransferase MiaA [Deinococcus soli (ex Cha et al. 2016)]AKH15771.1 tRNA dimethylallyltransferase [Deinococcus soli (ex Cha et al. 2016)]
MQGPQTVPILTAPTAAGKSALALEAALAYGAEVISADAFTVYRGLDIGTAKPSAADLSRVPHHLIDVAEVTGAFDVARFVALAEAAIGDVLARGRTPLVVGGTGFYLQGLMQGLPLTPPSDPHVRAQVEADLEARGLDALLADIAATDPAEAARMERNPRRVVRAVEVHRRTGRFPGSFGRSEPAFRYAPLAFTRPAPDLEARMHARVTEMFARGWADEAAWLAGQVEPEARPRPTVWQALGYREALAVARGSLSVEDAAAQVTLATRQYAKRQLTFMRTQLRAPVLSAGEVHAALRDVLSR